MTASPGFAKWGNPEELEDGGAHGYGFRSDGRAATRRWTWSDDYDVPMAPGWMTFAACASSDLDPTRERMTPRYLDKVLGMCEACPVRKKCLDYGMKHEQGYDIACMVKVLGGMTAEQRYWRHRRTRADERQYQQWAAGHRATEG